MSPFTLKELLAKLAMAGDSDQIIRPTFPNQVQVAASEEAYNLQLLSVLPPPNLPPITPPIPSNLKAIEACWLEVVPSLAKRFHFNPSLRLRKCDRT